jgi:hypothetical protein
MQPVGLTLKKNGKKYGQVARGELMVIHLCEECEKVSINRIAADDDPQVILALMEHSIKLIGSFQQRLESQGIHVLRQPDQPIVW